jgi:hypothetical protein
MAKAITPKQVVDSYKDGAHLPEFVIEAFNELIQKNFQKTRGGGYSTILQKDAMASILAKSPTPIVTQKVYDERWLDVEDFYRASGWKVEYDKPAYNESYEPSFKFEIARSNVDPY